PAREPQLGAPIVERLEDPRLRQHLAVRADVVSGPYDPARLEIEPLQPAVDAELAAGRADDNAVLYHEGCDGRGLALGQVRDPGLPQLLTRRRRDRDGVPIQQVVHDLSLGVKGAAIDRVAAGDARGIGV